MPRLLDIKSWPLLPLLVAAGGCTDREAHAQVLPEPEPPADVGEIEATRTAPARGEIPLEVAGDPGTGPVDLTRDRGDVIVINGSQIGGAPAETAEPFYYPPIEQDQGPQVSELYRASQEGGGPAGLAGAGQARAPRVSCVPAVEPGDLAEQVRELEELEDAAVGAEYKANLREAADMLEDASVEVRRETEQLEQAVSRADRISRRAMELATETDEG